MLVFAAVVTALLLGLVWWRAKDAPPSVLTVGAIPCSLILLALPVPWLMVRVTTTFQQIAAAGTNAVPRVSQVLLDVDRTLLWGSIGVALIVSMAIGRQLLLAREVPRSLTDFPESDTPDPALTWREWTLALTLVAVIPVVAVLAISSGVPRLVAGPGLDLVIGSGTSSPGGTQGLSETIAARLVAGTVGGVVSVVVVAFAVLAAIAVASSAAAADRLRRFATVAAAIVILGSVGNALRLVEEIGWIKTRVKMAAEAEARRAAPPPAEGSVSTSIGDAVPLDSPKIPPSANTDHERNTPGLALESLQRNGVYLSGQKFGDNFHFWKFNADGSCIPGAAPSEEHLFVPPPPPAGMQWTCAVVNDRLVFTFSSAGAKETTRGAIVSADHIRIEGVDYRYRPLKRQPPRTPNGLTPLVTLPLW